jgi:hypothetical protein
MLRCCYAKAQNAGTTDGHEASWQPGCMSGLVGGWVHGSCFCFSLLAGLLLLLLCVVPTEAHALCCPHITRSSGGCSAVMHVLRCLLVRLPRADCTGPDAIGTAASPTWRDFPPLWPATGATKLLLSIAHEERQTGSLSEPARQYIAHI